MSDLRFALRSIIRTPVSTAVVVLTLAVGIAGATALASVANAMLLRPLPLPDPDRVIAIGREPVVQRSNLELGTFYLLRERFTACAHIGARTGRPGINMTAGDRAEYVRNGVVTSGYLEALGIVPQYGRSFRLEDEQPGSPRITIIDSRLAERTFGSGRDAIGKALTLGGEPYDVVGVLPRIDASLAEIDVWLPLTNRRAQGLNYSVACRLKSDRSYEAAAAELSSLNAAHAAQYTGTPMRELANQRLGLASMHEMQTSGRRPLMRMLGVAVGFLLLIACANTAWLFSARAVDRRAESAVCVALGAGRWRVMRQILSESVVLTVAGGALGIVVAISSLPALLELQSEGWQAEMDVFVIGAIVFVSVAVGALCGLVPAFRHARLDPLEALQSGSRRLSAGRTAAPARRVMVFAEVAICMMLLVASGLLIRSLDSLQRVELGFDPQNVVTAQVSMDDARYTTAAAVSALYDRVLEQVKADPSVESAAVVTNIPIDQGLNLAIRAPVPVQGQEMVSVDWRYVTEDYFRTMRVPFREGRDFTSSDRPAAAHVAIVNDAFVQRYFPDGRALGHVIELAMGPEMRDPREIVGIVANTQQRGLATPPPPTIYVPVRQAPDGLFSMIHRFFPMSWVVRSRGSASAATEILGAAIRSADPRLPISRVRTMEGVVDAALNQQRMQAVLLSVFGLVSILMAVTALAGSILYAVMRRTREIGLRLALGASTRAMLRTIAGENIVLAAAGIAAGVGGALLFRQALQPFLFGVAPTDWQTYFGAGALLFCLAALASLFAATPVLRIDPAKTLRAE